MTRDDKGRFVKGSVGNPKGRPPKAAPQDYIDVFNEVLTVDRWRACIEAQIKRAERGDIQAFNALAARAMPITNKQEIAGTNGSDIIIRIAAPNDNNG